jgi:hypothetical protein
MTRCTKCIGTGCLHCDGKGEITFGQVWMCDTGLHEDDRWWWEDIPLKYFGHDVWQFGNENIGSHLVRPKYRLVKIGS